MATPVEPLHPAPGVFIWPLRTPTLPPATTTNTMLVVGKGVAVIEPATPDPALQDVLIAHVEQLRRAGCPLVAVLVTHHHRDHIGAVERLAHHFDAPIGAHRLTARRVPFVVDRELDDGDVVDLGGGRSLQVTATPGHAPGHVILRDTASNLTHVGDMVAGEGSVMIDPDDDGDMATYLDSLRRMQRLGLGPLVPAHGPILARSEDVLARYIEHRLAREAKVLAATTTVPLAIGDVLAVVYDDVPRTLWSLALRSLEAHLIKLCAEGHVGRNASHVWRER